jgi:enoyl-CoA hydratase/carnithine racemase
MQDNARPLPQAKEKVNMNAISVEHHDQVALLKLNRGVTNALNLALLDELAGALQGVKHDAGVRGLILSSANEKFFSIGFDIPHLYELSPKDFMVFYRAFNRTCMALYTLPKPVIAALTGHAIAGGCILALCCDYRFIAQGHKLMGLNEIKLGVPLPYLTDCILERLVGFRNAREITDTGAFYPPEKSLAMGLVDQVLPQEQVLAGSIAKAAGLGAFPPLAFALIKRNRIDAVEAQVLARLDEKERLFVECWYSDEARERQKAAMEKF